MELLVRGATNEQIAERFVVTEGTVKALVTHVYRKLHAANRAEAVHRYMRCLRSTTSSWADRRSPPRGRARGRLSAIRAR